MFSLFKKKQAQSELPLRGKTNEQIRQERAELVQKLENKGYEVQKNKLR